MIVWVVCSRRMLRQASLAKPSIMTRSGSWPQDLRVTAIKSSHDVNKPATSSSGDAKKESVLTMNEWLTQFGSSAAAAQPSVAETGVQLRASRVVGRRHKCENSQLPLLYHQPWSS